MFRKTTRRHQSPLSIESLEGRDIPSGLGATPPGAPQSSSLLPYVEQDNLRVPTVQAPTPGAPAGIIAILIG